MFAGHVGAALAIGRAERRVNVGVLIFAALLLDAALWLFVLLGWESLTIPADFARTHQPEFVFPYSHGLVAGLAWSVLAGAVFSHWLLDVLVHGAELPLAGAGSVKLGLGLWRQMPVALAVEALIVFAGLPVCLDARPIRPVDAGRAALRGMRGAVGLVRSCKAARRLHAVAADGNNPGECEMAAAIDRWTLRRWGAVSLACTLVACGGGGGGEGPAGEVPPPVTPVSPSAPSVLSQAESIWVRDDPAVYGVLTDTVLTGQVITRDGPVYSFADVNADVDDTDADVPEIDAHIVLDGYPDDGKATNATIRLRGHSSRLAPQKSYRIKLAKAAALWRGEQTLQFNKHPWDLSRVRNKLAMDLFRSIPHMPSLRTQFVRLDVTNLDSTGAEFARGDFGLFTHVEKMGKEYLANRGLPTDGNLYKAESFTFEQNSALGLTDTGAAKDKAAFETVLSLEADSGDHRALIAMITAVNDPAADFETLFARHFDRANYLTWLATAILMGNRDTLVQNFALSQPKGGEKFYFLPWDYDGSFGFEDQPDQLLEDRLYAPWQKSVGNWWNVPLHRRFIADPARLAELKQAVEIIYAAHLTEARIKALLDGYKPLVQPRVSVAPDLGSLPASPGGGLVEWEAEFDRLPASVRKHRDQFLAGLEAPMPFFTALNLVGGNHVVTWGPSVDLQGEAVTYTVELATSPAFTPGTVVELRTGLTGTELLLPRQADGNHYLRVTARDASGHTQQAFDRAEVAGKVYFGVLPVVIAGGVVTVS